MYAFLRYDARSGQRWLVVANLHRDTVFEDVQIRIPAEAVHWLGLSPADALSLRDRLGGSLTLSATAADLPGGGVVLPNIPALSAMYLEIIRTRNMKNPVAAPFALALFGLVSLWLLSPMTHSPEPLIKFGALILPLILTLSGMSWLITRLRS